MEKGNVHEENADQATYWNGAAGRRWTDRQETLDRVLNPIQDILLTRAGISTAERVVDIGCGCGASTIALARRVGARGRVVGVHISAPMLASARGPSLGVRPCRCHRARVRGRRCRPYILPLRCDVLRRSQALFSEYAHGAAGRRPTFIRRLARAAAEPLDASAAAGSLQTCAAP